MATYKCGKSGVSVNAMRGLSLLIALIACLYGISLHAQTSIPGPPLTAEQADLGKRLAATSEEIRAQIEDMSAPAEPFRMIGNLYFAGVQNGEVYILTSPEGHIMFGAGWADSAEGVERNIASLGIELTDIEVILLNHYHGDQSGAAAYFKERTGAQVMIGFAEVPFMEYGGSLPGDGGSFQYPSVKIDRALHDGDVIQVGPLSVTAYLVPGHSPSPTSFVYTVRDGDRDYKTIQFCCWEYPEEISERAYINEASVRHTFETLRSLLPVDIYLELGVYAWGGVVSQPGDLTITERIDRVKADPSLLVNREVFAAWTAAREVEFEEKLQRAGDTRAIYRR